MKNLNISLKKINFIKICKIALGSSIAILIANLLGLSYSASAGIITLLSIQDTKKETLLIAGKRILAFFLALLIAFFLFQTFGYYTFTFGGFLLLFVSLSYLFGLQDGVAMCSVLITHFLIERNMEFNFIFNEILIFLIGTIVGVILNLFIPGNKKAVTKDMRVLEDIIRGILIKMADCIVFRRVEECSSEDKKGTDTEVWEGVNTDCSNRCALIKEFDTLDKHLKSGLAKAYSNMNNTLLSDTRYYLQYFTMRQSQFHILMHIKEQLQLLTKVPKQAEPIAKFIKNIAEQFHEYNSAEGLIKELNTIKAFYKEEPGPVTREEFENRAVLYLILYDLEEFLNIKRNFVNEITDKQIELFWKKQL